VRRKDRPATQSAAATSTAERLAAIVEAAERAAVTVIDDAEKQARQHLEQAQAEAARALADRLASLSDLTDSLVAEAESIRSQSERLLSSLEEAKRRLATEAGMDGGDRDSVGPSRSSHLSAVAAVEEPDGPAPVEAAPAPEERGTAAGARLLATQMAVSGNSREEIEARLRNGFDIEDTASILDAILGPGD
jgi:vacuolar-type H+-ATPase subunit H